MTERKDKLKNKAKVVKAVLENPLDTMEKIAKKAWVSKATVSRQVNELKQTETKDNRILWITDKDLAMIIETQQEILRRVREEPTEVSTQDLIRAWDSSTKRHLIFWDRWDDKQRDITIQI